MTDQYVEVSNGLKRLVLAALFLALGLMLPLLTGNIPQVGRMLLPMHFPVLLCGFVCGWKYGFSIGFILPFLRSLLFGMPAIFPDATAMAFELAAYGAISGILYPLLPKKSVGVYISLIGAMLAGRVIWGLVRWALTIAPGTEFSWALFVAGGFVNAWPGIVAQIVLIPLIVLALRRARLID